MSPLKEDLVGTAARGDCDRVYDYSSEFSVPPDLPGGEDERVSQSVIFVLLGGDVRPVQTGHQQLRRKGRTHSVVINIKMSQ